MSTNQYFTKFTQINEQSLYESLVIESIQMMGIDIQYIPRVVKAFDEIYQSDAISEYNTYYDIEVYVKSVNGFEGDGTFLSKFGLEIRDQVTFSIAIRRFNNEITFTTGQARPNEGDLVFLPLGNRVFQIKYVNHRPQFYPLGSLNVYDLVCETFSYSSEKFNTGIVYLDSLNAQYSMDTAVTGNTNFELPFDVSADNIDVQIEANTSIDFSITNPFGDLSK